MPPASEILRPWHDLLMLIGTASATLVGLLFVAASVGWQVFTPERQNGLRAFLSPSVVHFTSVLTACIIALAPLPGWRATGLLVAADGLAGAAYAIAVWRRMIVHRLTALIDREDFAWYALLPALGHAGLLGAGAVLALGRPEGCLVLALAMVMLLLAGIRNAWDMTVWVVLQRRE